VSYNYEKFEFNTVPPLRRTRGVLTSISTGLASGACPAPEVITSLTRGTSGVQYLYSVSRNPLAILLAWVMPSPDQLDYRVHTGREIDDKVVGSAPHITIVQKTGWVGGITYNATEIPPITTR